MLVGATPVTAPVKELLTPSVCRALCLPACIAVCTTYIQTRIVNIHLSVQIFALPPSLPGSFCSSPGSSYIFSVTFGAIVIK